MVQHIQPSIPSLYLVYSVEDGELMEGEQIRKIGQSGVEAAQKMEKAFNKLLNLYVKELRKRRALEEAVNKVQSLEVQS